MYYFLFQEKGMCSDYKDYNFKDRWGSACFDMILSENCINQRRSEVTRFNNGITSLATMISGISVNDACCACGGGEIGKLMHISRHLFQPLYYFRLY